MDIELIKAEVLRIRQTPHHNSSSLEAIKYIRQETGLSLKAAKETFDKWMYESKTATPQLQRIITWHPMSELPDIDPEEPTYSKDVLVRYKTLLSKATYSFGRGMWIISDDEFVFTPTEWAYIDFLPE